MLLKMQNHKTKQQPLRQRKTLMQQITTAKILSLAAVLVLLHSGCATNNGEILSPSDEASMNATATAALQNLYASNPAAKVLGAKARAILIFPDILKAGFMFGGQIGNGVLRQNGRTVGYYNTVAASYGLQAGIQSFGYAMFLMNDAAIAHLNATGGWEVGVGPSVVIVDQGMASSITTTTLNQDIYAFIFNQTGLMAGAGLQGSKITRIQQ
jgi:lipid-binding SYLF domain-containing protein